MRHLLVALFAGARGRGGSWFVRQRHVGCKMAYSNRRPVVKIDHTVVTRGTLRRDRPKSASQDSLLSALLTITLGLVVQDGVQQ